MTEATDLRLASRLRAGPTYASVLREDPELALGLSEDDRRAAVSLFRAPVIQVSSQRWTPPHYDPARTFGLIVLDGLLGRRVRVGRTVGTELLGVGDILRPWDDEQPFELVPATLDWRVFSPTRLAVLDDRITTLIGRRAQLVVNFSGRIMRQSRRATYLMVVSHLPRIEDRVLTTLWHIASTCGKVTPEGVSIPFRITHEVLGEIVGAHRPSVTVAIQTLETRGKLIRTANNGFILPGMPPEWEARAQEPEQVRSA
jgi:CRP/FNR family transcriptional regulator, cyclic AMP receptor protein